MLVTLVLLASYPLWAEHVGLYQYLGIEVAVWMVYALGYNLLLGYTGLPAFGQGAFFGVGAYAYGLCYLHWSQNPFLALICGSLAGGAAAATRRLLGLSPARHLLRAPHDRVRPGLLVLGHEGHVGDRR